MHLLNSQKRQIITHIMYLEPGQTSADLLSKFFTYIQNSKYNDYTFYAHNQGKFDGIFVLFNLVEHGFKIKTVMKKDNTFISITIRHKRKTIKLLDSLLMLNGSLAKLGKDFKLNITKDIFPHKFAQLDTLFRSITS